MKTGLKKKLQSGLGEALLDTLKSLKVTKPSKKTLRIIDKTVAKLAAQFKTEIKRLEKKTSKSPTAQKTKRAAPKKSKATKG